VNALDVGLIVLVVLGAGLGLARGFVRILIGILSLIVAFILASRYQDTIAQVLMGRHVGETPARIGAYILIFVATMIAGGLVAWVVGKILKIAMLSWADRLAGGALGVVAALLAAAFVIHPVVASFRDGSDLLAKSKLAPYVAVVADVVNAATPDAVGTRYEQGMDALRKVWRGGEQAVDEVKKRVAAVPSKKP
jgi:membrane protein required for colicin V production